MFMEVPGKYDILNRIITWRQDEKWRRHAVREILKDKPEKVLDLCTGTGDILFRIAESQDAPDSLVGYDFSKPMLDEARLKGDKKGLDNYELIFGDAADMPFEDGRFDAIGIAFAFRNLTFKNPDSEKFLKEIFRVTKPGGKFVIVETSRPNTKLGRFFHALYMSVFVEIIGGILSGNMAAYKYLSYSARNYYKQDEVVELLKQTGYSSVSYKRFMGGIAALHVAVK